MTYKTCFILCSIVIMGFSLRTQAQHVSYRSTAHYNKRVAEFERTADIDSTSIVMLGNSLTENAGDWSRRLRRDGVVNRGIIGDNTTGMSERLCQITPHHPRAICLMAGINDMSGGISAIEVAARVNSLIETIHQQSPQTKLFVQSILPINESNGRWRTLTDRTDDIPWANMLIRAYCESHGIVYVDIFPYLTYYGSNRLRANLTSDGLHLNEQGYAIWQKKLRQELHRNLGAE
jgi:lysophospholipase L1-like esterase